MFKNYHVQPLSEANHHIRLSHSKHSCVIIRFTDKLTELVNLITGDEMSSDNKSLTGVSVHELHSLETFTHNDTITVSMALNVQRIFT